MSEQKYPFLPVLHEGWNEHRRTVTAATLFDYLGSNMRVDYKDVKFDNRLDLGSLTPMLTELQNTTLLGYVHTPEERQVLSELQNPFASGDPKITEMWAPVKEKYDTLAGLQAPVERSRIVVYNLQENMFQVTRVKQGDYRSVQNDLFTVIDEGLIPILPIHTHPNNVLPSPQDYMSLILDISKSPRSPANVTMVLCPSTQVLAIATPQTPLLKSAEAVAVRDYWNEQLDSEKDPRLISFAERENSTMPEYGEYAILMQEKLYTQAEEILNQLHAGRITREEFEIRQRALSDYYINKITKKSEQLSKKRLQVMNRAYEYAAQSTNAVLMECARSLNIQLYVSRNMKDFRKCTA